MIKYVVNTLLRPARAAGNGMLAFIRYLIKRVGDLFRFIGSILKKVSFAVGSALYTAIKNVLSVVGKVIKFLVTWILAPIKGLNNIYFSIFKFLLVSCRSLGIIGELIFTVIGLAYLFWPLAVAYYLGRNEFYIPGVILTIILIV
jgi:hypothetical protein